MSEKRRPQSLGEFLFTELRTAIQDIRQKVVEEGWFGRAVTPSPVIEMGKEAPVIGSDLGERQRGIPLTELWAPREQGKPVEPELERDHDDDFDR